MKYLKIIGEHLRAACVYFAAAQILIAAVYQFSGAAEKGGFITLWVELMLFGFSVLFAVAQDIFKIEKLSLMIRTVLHFLCCMLIVFLLYVAINGKDFRAQQIVFVLVAAVFLYAVIAAVALPIRFRKSKKQEEEYTPVFKNGKADR